MERQAPILDWLLGEDNPPVRYLTLKNLLDTLPSDPAVVAAQARLMEYSVTTEILKHADDFWALDDKAYWKYTGKYWQLIFLGQFLANGKHPEIAKGIPGILDQLPSIASKGWLCLAANLAGALIRLGYDMEPVVSEAAETIAGRVVGDRGIACSEMTYSLLPRCYMAIPKVLRCFAEIPERERSAQVVEAIGICIHALLEHEVFVYVPGNRKAWKGVLDGLPKKADLPEGETVKGWIAEKKSDFLAVYGIGDRDPKPGWHKFGFPLNYNSDILEAMSALAALRVPMQAELVRALQIIREKRTAEGQWILENSLNDKMWADVEVKGLPSKWITLHALMVLKHFGT